MEHKEKKMGTLEVGDIVSLKSGGPAMTLDTIIDAKTLCMWFNTDRVKYEGYFKITSLKKVEPNLKHGVSGHGIK